MKSKSGKVIIVLCYRGNNVIFQTTKHVLNVTDSEAIDKFEMIDKII